MFDEIIYLEDLEMILEKVKHFYGVRLFIETRLSIMRSKMSRETKPSAYRTNLFREKVRKNLKKRGVTFPGSSLVLKNWNVISSMK